MGVSRKTVNDWESDAKILDKSPDQVATVTTCKQVQEQVNSSTQISGKTVDCKTFR